MCRVQTEERKVIGRSAGAIGLQTMRILYVTGAIVVFDQVAKLLVKGFSISFLDFYHPGVPLGSSTAVFGDFSPM